MLEDLDPYMIYAHYRTLQDKTTNPNGNYVSIVQHSVIKSAGKSACPYIPVGCTGTDIVFFSTSLEQLSKPSTGMLVHPIVLN